MDLLVAGAAGIWATWILPITMVVIGLGVVIFVHELGHFLMAKRAGIYVEVFSIGMGPRLFGIRRKETDYRISMIPLGGYVKMMGQEDFAPLKDGDPNPRSFANKPVGVRFAVIAAGVVMNVIFAAIAFIVVGLIGIRFDAPVVGGAQGGYPAAKARIVWDDRQDSDDLGLRPGDTILTINGKPIEGFQQIRALAVLADRDDEFEFVFRRTEGENERIGRATIGVTFAHTGGSRMLAFGIASASDLVFAGPSDLILPDDGVAPGDRVIAIDGVPIQHAWELPDFEQSLTGEAVTVTIRRADSEDTYTVAERPRLRMTGPLVFLTDGERIRPTDTRADDSDRRNPKLIFTLSDGSERTVSPSDVAEVVMDVIGLQPRMTVRAVSRGSPAEDAGLQPGDIILGYAGRGPPTLVQFLKINSEFVDHGTQILIERQGQTLPPIDIRPKRKNDQVLVGTDTGIDEQHLLIAHVRPGSPTEQAGILSGDVVTHVDGRAVSSWLELVNALADAQQSPGPVELSVKRGVNTFTVELPELALEQFDRSDYSLLLFAGPRGFVGLRSPLIRHTNPISAVVWGVGKTLDFLYMGYMQFPSMFKGNVSLGEVSGPVGIGGLAIRSARQGPIYCVYFMAFISVILAVVNFLPIPVVDGGHAVLLIIEKIRGRPFSARVMNIIQLVGVILLFGILIVVTWRDIAKMLSNIW